MQSITRVAIIASVVLAASVRAGLAHAAATYAPPAGTFPMQMTAPGYACPTPADTAPFAPADPACVSGVYTLTDAADVLRLLYFGLDHDFRDATSRNCGNPNTGNPSLHRTGQARAALVENWYSQFPPAPCPGCTRLWRVFREADASPATLAFVPTMARTATCAAVGGPCTSIGAIVSISVPGPPFPFCNARQSQGAQCGPGEQGGFDDFTNPNVLPHRITATPLNSRAPVDADPPAPPTAAGGPARFADPNPVFNGWDFPDASFGPLGGPPYPPDTQDFDCIRRECSGLFGATAQEEVCSARGDMGVVLPIWDPPIASATVDPWPTVDCAPGVFVAVAAPPCLGTGGTAKPSLCPNGEKPSAPACTLPMQNPGVCLAPATASPALDPRCRNSALNYFGAQRRVDARVYNLHLHQYDVAPNPDHPYAFTGAQRMVAAFYRIHSAHFLAVARPNHFILRSATNFDTLASTPSGGTGACSLLPASQLINCFNSTADLASR